MGSLPEQAVCAALRSETQFPGADPFQQPTPGIHPRRRNAAVLVPLIASPEGWQVLFTRRTDTVPTHKGLVSFPGGGAEEQDRGPAETAEREAWEEIGLPPGQTRICGYLDTLDLEITGLTITPVIGIIPWPFEVRKSEKEVKRVFTVPLDWLADEKNYRFKHYEERENPAWPSTDLFYDEYDGETVWGLTAYITVGLVKRLRGQEAGWDEIFEPSRNADRESRSI